MSVRGAIPRLAMVWLLGFLAAVAVTAESAAASSGTSMADTDGYVPVYSVCYSGHSYLAYYAWESDGYGNVTGAVYVDDCLLADFGAGPYDRERVVAHEMGHAWGLVHSSDPGHYMYPYYTVTGT